MVLNKVEICGVNTTKLPLLSDGEKEVLLRRSKRGMRRQKNSISKEICVWYSV